MRYKVTYVTYELPSYNFKCKATMVHGLEE